MAKRKAGLMKRWLEDISVEMGLDGEITPEVIKKAEKMLQKTEREEERKRKKGSLRSVETDEVLERFHNVYRNVIRAALTQKREE